MTTRTDAVLRQAIRPKKAPLQLLTGGLLVRVQPEEPIFSRTYRYPLGQPQLTVGDFVGGLLRFRWPSHARQVPAQRRTATRDVTARCPVGQHLLVRLKSADRVFPLLAVWLSLQSARIASPCESWSLDSIPSATRLRGRPLSAPAAASLRCVSGRGNGNRPPRSCEL